jgi:hypothetical protein
MWYSIISALALCLAGAVAAEERVWLIGGGPDVYGSQAQIELNTLWALRTIESLPGRRAIAVWYDDGDDPAPDVHEWRVPADSARNLQPLSRVMDSQWANGLVYRNHRLPGVLGSTRSDLLAGALSEQAGKLRPGDAVWLIFNGHGRREEGLNNTMELWDRSWLHVDELARVLEAVPPEVPLRFLFTQCYSGAFARLADHGPNRCGFLAEAADREAEGCSAAIEKRDFEDYGSHFFAALSGRHRNGAPVAGNPDRNGDGAVSPLEAHYHTLLNAGSADIPRATSENLLEQWRPWYRPLAAYVFDDADTVYRQLAREMMADAGLADVSAIAPMLDALKATFEEKQRQLSAMLREGELRTVREALEDELLRRWPAVGYPYTTAFRRFLAEDLASAQAFLLARPEYRQLVRLQEKYHDDEQELLALERAVARLEKIAHLLKLGRRLAMLRAFGPSELERRYDKLLNCENRPF